jgi:hypothetical protein
LAPLLLLLLLRVACKLRLLHMLLRGCPCWHAEGLLLRQQRVLLLLLVPCPRLHCYTAQ